MDDISYAGLSGRLGLIMDLVGAGTPKRRVDQQVTIFLAAFEANLPALVILIASPTGSALKAIGSASPPSRTLFSAKRLRPKRALSRYTVTGRLLRPATVADKHPTPEASSDRTRLGHRCGPALVPRARRSSVSPALPAFVCRQRRIEPDGWSAARPPP